MNLINKTECVDVGTVLTFRINNVGAVPTFEMPNVGAPVFLSQPQHQRNTTTIQPQHCSWVGHKNDCASTTTTEALRSANQTFIDHKYTQYKQLQKQLKPEQQQH